MFTNLSAVQINRRAQRRIRAGSARISLRSTPMTNRRHGSNHHQDERRMAC